MPINDFLKLYHTICNDIIGNCLFAIKTTVLPCNVEGIRTGW